MYKHQRLVNSRSLDGLICLQADTVNLCNLCHVFRGVRREVFKMTYGLDTKHMALYKLC